MIIDLTQPLNSDTPVYPGDPKTSIKPAGNLKKDGYCDHLLSIGTHVGTHIDAPSHMLEDGKTLNQMPITKFAGRGVYIEVVNKKFRLEDVKNANIKEGDIVLFHTGMSESYDNPKVYFEEFPALPKEIAEYLVEKKVNIVGLDTCSPDRPDFEVHKILLSNDVLIIENLANLDKLKGKQFKIYALPINLQIDGAPARVIAETN